MDIARVIVDVPTSQTNRTFDYKIPPHLEGVVDTGMRVIVPFGPRKIMGFVIGITDESKHDRLKAIGDVMDLTPVLTGELLELGRWIADTTLCLHISALQAMLPQVLKAKYEKEIHIIGDREQLPDRIQLVSNGRGYFPFDDVTEAGIPYSVVQKAMKEGTIELRYKVKGKETLKKIPYIAPAVPVDTLYEEYEGLSKQAKKQRLITSYFIEYPTEIEEKKLLEELNTTKASLKPLIDKGTLSRVYKEVYRSPYEEDAFERTEPLTLTEEQKDAITPIWRSVTEKRHETFLLHGVTGSGKTEVYLQSIQQVIEEGREAIVLVPEIALTPQTVERFKSRFGSNVAVLHSALSKGEKFDEWRKVQRKEVQVVVGARSAIFAPFQNLGIIIIDEEHETSYKQEDHPRYHARDVAIYRGEQHDCPIVLGSATPTLETYARAKKGVYTLLSMTKRMNEASMPEVERIDMREELHAGNRSMFSRSLFDKIQERMAKGEQTVLFLNRRGYSTFVMCRDCGHVSECPHCDIALTYHRKNDRLKCHYCSYEEAMPTVCPSCESDTIRYFGTGTQKIEESLQQLLPEARIIRMDVDTTRQKGAHERLLTKFGNKEADILLGTQMIAKGLDFGNVTLVGVLAADSLLHLPDFRSSEKTFQLLTQVSGRAGRDKLPGEVVVQSYTPEHYSIEMASQYDYESFYLKEMKMRKLGQYPPYYFLTLVTVSHPNQLYAMDVIRKVVTFLQEQLSEETVILGPTPSPLARIKDRYRHQCMIKYRNEPNLTKVMKRLFQLYEDEIQNKDLQLTIDFQPYHMM
ncbi:primosomal protein N' [Pontibacillus halophilus JSM 076056 = DSM 19796]|uniref:Replication restart protein PriA n=1 Tax=Pontibacillus halophilus JSM 076056 = DSM 19796 TaxID=1385510 RepID=A0A0A5GPX2_9BACI|nr:primosomal protein N' [Pontibacillus halophilus]KGX93220.1 primosomal protein N' [Pontibacillus halophilus JSM 076056 = DSM 19796]